MRGIDELLPPPLPPARPLPWRAIAAFFIPAAALAAGTGLHRAFELQQPNPVEQWLSWSSAAGLIVGFACGLLLKRKWIWASWGAVSPWLAGGLYALAIRAAR